jgi:hypothetical protein
MNANMPPVNSFLMGGLNNNTWINLSGNTFLDIGENLPPNKKIYDLVYN